MMTTSQPRTTVRFWVTGAQGNPARITLRVGETLRHCHGGWPAEGWTREDSTWSFHGERLALSEG